MMGCMIQSADLCAPPKQSERQTLDRPLDHLVACHRRIEDRLATLERLTPHFRERREEALQALRSCLRFFDSNGVWHTEDEELSLFPRLAPLLSEEERGYVAGLERQHDVAEAAYAELKEVAETLESEPSASDASASKYAAAVTRLAGLYRAHITSEDARLVEIGRKYLSEESLAGISLEMKRRRGLLP
jgi:hemerythrin-like domain-containing protein